MLGYLKNKKGWAMALVIVVLAVVPIFVTALYTYAMSATKIVSAHIGFEKSRYIARSGLEAAMAAWRDAPISAKPSGTLERVYFMNDGTLMKESDLAGMTEEEIDEATKGYVDVEINDISDTYASVSVQTQIIARGNADGVGHEIEAISIPYTEGHTVGWYNPADGLFNQSNSQQTIEHDGEDVFCFVFDGVVTNSLDSAGDDFDFPEGATAIIAETLFFNNEVYLDASYSWFGIEAEYLLISAKKVIFRDRVRLDDTGRTYDGKRVMGTLILVVPEYNAIEVPGHAGKYGIVYFKDDVVKNSTTIISAGSNYYFKDIENGIDLIKWSEGEYNSDPDAFFPVPSSSIDDSYTPTEASSIYFQIQ